MRRKPKHTKPIVYRNKKFGFAIVFPSWWKSYTVVGRKVYGDLKESFLPFRFRYQGKLYSPIVTIHISKLTGNAWKHYYNDSPVAFLCEHNGLTYGYLLPEELPSAFLRPDRLDYDYEKYSRPIRILKRLVAQAPKVLRTIHFPEELKSKVGCSCSRRLRRKRKRLKK